MSVHMEVTGHFAEISSLLGVLGFNLGMDTVL